MAGTFEAIFRVQHYRMCLSRNWVQGRHGEFEQDKAHSTVVGIICPPPPPVEIGLTVTQNLGKGWALEA